MHLITHSNPNRDLLVLYGQPVGVQMWNRCFIEWSGGGAAQCMWSRWVITWTHRALILFRWSEAWALSGGSARPCSRPRTGARCLRTCSTSGLGWNPPVWDARRLWGRKSPEPEREMRQSQNINCVSSNSSERSGLEKRRLWEITALTPLSLSLRRKSASLTTLITH